MKKILLINLGGTISCITGPKGLIPTKSPDFFIKKVPSLKKLADITTKQLLKRTIVYPKDWIFLSNYILNEEYKYDGVIITLGTDSLAYTSSALSFLLKEIQKPIVLTGAMIPLSFKNSDAKKNIIDSVLFSTKSHSGVFIVFSGKVILGTRVSKVKSNSIDAFESINSPPYATIKNGKIIYSKKLKINPLKTKRISKLNENVASIILNPQISPKIFKSFENYDGLVILAYGDGNISDNLVHPIKNILKRQKPVVIASQCTYERTEHKYTGGKEVIKAGGISSKDMTKETCLVKLMWCLSQTKSMGKIKQMMHTSYCGEITE